MPEKKPSSNAVIYRVVELFMKEEKPKVEAIVTQVNLEFPNAHLNRQSIYNLLREAEKVGILRKHPPAELELERSIHARFGVENNVALPEIKNITVVDAPRPESSDAVSLAAADVVYKLIKRCAPLRGGQGVGLGLGPGRATLSFSQSLSERMKLDKEDIAGLKLNLFGISSSCLPDHPHFAPVSFFNLFPPENVNETLALFSQALVRSKDFEKTKTQIGVKEVFKKKDGIDIVVTSMGNMLDPHTLYKMFMHSGYEPPEQPPAWLETCVADVQYRPFSKEGPIEEGPDDQRLVTLFELKELVAMASQKNKFVVLIARQCSHCDTQMTRAKGLLPIMTNPDLKLYTHLVLDSPTAKELLEEADKNEAEPGANVPSGKSSKSK